VSLIRQLGNDRCEQGSSWGYTDRGIWVDRGCRGEFGLYYRATGDNSNNDKARFARLDPGTVVPIRTDQLINSERSDGRIYTGTVAHDIVDDNGRLAIPRGSIAELRVQVARDNDLILDLESLIVNGGGMPCKWARTASNPRKALERIGEPASSLEGAPFWGLL
jgi:hypothetical protein